MAPIFFSLFPYQAFLTGFYQYSQTVQSSVCSPVSPLLTENTCTPHLQTFTYMNPESRFLLTQASDQVLPLAVAPSPPASFPHLSLVTRLCIATTLQKPHGLFVQELPLYDLTGQQTFHILVDSMFLVENGHSRSLCSSMTVKSPTMKSQQGKSLTCGRRSRDFVS